MRALGIELRRSAALWTGLLIVLLSLGMFYGLSGPWSKGTDAWTEEWVSLALWQRWMLNMTWPLALGAGAWQGRRDRRAKMDELLSTMPKPPILRAMPLAVAMSIGVTAAYLVFFLVGAVQVIGNASYHGVEWIPITLVGILSLITAILAGMGIGRLLPYLLTAPIVALLGFATMTVALVGGPDTGSVLAGAVSHKVTLLAPIFYDPQNLFVVTSARVDLLQALWFVGLAVTGFGLFTLVGGKARLAAVIPTVAALAIALPLLPSSAADTFQPSAAATALVCEDRVCVSRVHKDHLADVVGPAKQALSELARLPGAPTRVEEARVSPLAMDSMPQTGDIVYFHFEDWDFRRDHRRTILAGPALIRCHDDDKYTASEIRRIVVASWFDGRLMPVVPRSPSVSPLMTAAEQTWQELVALPADQQPARVASLRAEARMC